MNIPTKNKDWLREIKEALASAEIRAVNDSIEIQFLYRYTPQMVADKRGITDTKTIDHIHKEVEKDIKQQWSLDDRFVGDYKFYFVSSYIFCHVLAELIEDIPSDRVMDYVNKNIDLFDQSF